MFKCNVILVISDTSVENQQECLLLKLIFPARLKINFESCKYRINMCTTHLFTEIVLNTWGAEIIFHVASFAFLKVVK